MSNNALDIAHQPVRPRIRRDIPTAATNATIG